MPDTQNNVDELTQQVSDLVTELKEERKQKDDELSKQATVDSSEAKISEQALKEEQQFKNDVLNNLESLNGSERSDLTDDKLDKLNSNIETLIEYQSKQMQSNVNSEFIGTVVLLTLVIGLSVYALAKCGMYVVNKIMAIINY